MVVYCETRPTECDGTCEYCPKSTKKRVRKPKKKSKGE